MKENNKSMKNKVFRWLGLGVEHSECSKVVKCQNDFELAVRATKHIESALVDHFQAPDIVDQSGGATGGSYHTPLHQRITTAKFNNESLPEDLQKQMRFITSVRNKIVHQKDFNAIPNRSSFIEAYKQVDAQLEKLIKAQTKTPEESKSNSCVLC